MGRFVEIQADKRSFSLRKPVFGVGVNDSEYKIKSVQNPKTKCPFYSRWHGMLKRCYDKSYIKDNPTYTECNVCDEWLIFSSFKKWMIKQDWVGKELDKDILIAGNKTYSPNTCMFVSCHVNSLLLACKRSRGKYPLGVCYDKARNKFMVMCKIKGRHKFLGRYNSPEEAETIYNIAKSKEIVRVANTQTDPRIKSGLLRHAKLRLNA